MDLLKKIIHQENNDKLIFGLNRLLEIPELNEFVTYYLEGDYIKILHSSNGLELYNHLVGGYVTKPVITIDEVRFNKEFSDELVAIQTFIIGLSAFNAFLQANITGPYIDRKAVFPRDKQLRRKLLDSLEIDGVSVYQETPFIETFCLARMVFTVFFPRTIGKTIVDFKWISLRINFFHQRLLLHSCRGSLRDSNLLYDCIEQSLINLDGRILGPETSFSDEEKVQYLLEKLQIYIMQGYESKAVETLKMVKSISGFSYILSGALGKRTRFQQTDTSQLVVFAKSRQPMDSNYSEFSLLSPQESNGAISVTSPEVLALNDDTLLESIAFSERGSEALKADLPSRLADLTPNNQPRLSPLDQITLLIEATLRDKFSPFDQLRSEEILPYATRILQDNSVNWQIYTQALLIRSRIELNRSRTFERSILQLQAIVDQIIAETKEVSLTFENSSEVPENKPISFLPKAKPHESASAHERLKYVFSLNTSSRWELETELAFAWSSIGSFMSAINIFKRLQLWAEVALCYHSVSQQGKARQIIRRQLYYSEKGKVMDQYGIDAEEIADEKWEGEIRPTPPHAPRLWCILGDLDQDPLCWERAWTVSQHRYARAQRSLGEYFIKLGDLKKARNAYYQASIAHRQNSDTWSRLGDLDLKLGDWENAIFAFQQSIMLDDTDAKTYSNLGSALLSKYNQLSKNQLSFTSSDKVKAADEYKREEVEHFSGQSGEPYILIQVLKAYKRAANLAHSNWKMWENVITISLHLSPPSYSDILFALRNIVRIRSPSLGENAVDINVLKILIAEVTSQEYSAISKLSGECTPETNIYSPLRGSLAHATLKFLQEDVDPLLTARPELYELMGRIALYQKDFNRALEYSTKAWRVITRDEEWLLDETLWAKIVESTLKFVNDLQSYGPMPLYTNTTHDHSNGTTDSFVEAKWRQKAKKAIQSVLGRARDTWEDSEGWNILHQKMEEIFRV